MTHKNSFSEQGISQNVFTIERQYMEQQLDYISPLHDRLWNHNLYNVEENAKSFASSNQRDGTWNKEDVKYSSIAHLSGSNPFENGLQSSQKRKMVYMSSKLHSGNTSSNWNANSQLADLLKTHRSPSSNDTWKELFRIRDKQILNHLPSNQDNQTKQYNAAIDMDTYKAIYLKQTGLNFILPFQTKISTENEESELTFLTYESENILHDLSNLPDFNLSWREIVRLLGQVLYGLYSADIVHGSLSPSCIKIRQNYATGRLQAFITNWGQFDHNYRILPGDTYFLEENAVLSHYDSMVLAEEYHEERAQYINGRNKEMDVSEEESEHITHSEYFYAYKFNSCSRNIDMFRVGILFYTLLTGDKFCVYKHLQENRQATISRMNKKLMEKDIDFGVQSLVLMLIHPENDFHYDAFLCYLQYRGIMDILSQIRMLLTLNPEEVVVREYLRKFEEQHKEIARRDSTIDNFFILQHADVLVEYACQDLVEYCSSEDFSQFLLGIMKQKYTLETGRIVAVLLRNIRSRRTFIERIEGHIAQAYLDGELLDEIKSFHRLIENELSSKRETFILSKLISDIELQENINAEWRISTEQSYLEFPIHLNLLSFTWSNYIPIAALPTSTSLIDLASDSVQQFYKNMYPGRRLKFSIGGTILLNCRFNNGSQLVEIPVVAAIILNCFNDCETYTLSELHYITQLPYEVLKSSCDLLLENKLLIASHEVYQMNPNFQIHGGTLRLK